MAHEYEDAVARIAKNIRDLRRQQGLTVQDLAYRCDMERSNVSRLEGGRSNPTLRTLCVLGNALRVPLSELIR